MELHELVDKAYEVRERKYAASAVVKALDEEFDALEAEIISLASNTGVKTFGTDTAKISLSEETVFSSENWELTFAYIAENEAFHLLKKSLNNAPLRDMLVLGEVVPGVSSFTKKKLSLRKA